MSTSRANWLPMAAAVGFVCVALFIFGHLTDDYWLRLVAKPFPVLALIAALLAKRRTTYAKIISVGLALCVVGDILLEIGDQTFLFGMVAFLLGHVAYIVAFVRRERRLHLVAAIPFAAWVAWASVVLMPHLGDFQIPVTVYTIVILVMMWRATSLVLGEQAPSTWDWLAMLGAMLFGFSDTLIALNKFHETIEGVRIPIILTYWGGQALIAASASSPNAALADDPSQAQ